MSVEWSERNETKGKEIELEALYALNQSLFVIIRFNYFLFIKNLTKLNLINIFQDH